MNKRKHNYEEEQKLQLLKDVRSQANQLMVYLSILCSDAGMDHGVRMAVAAFGIIQEGYNVLEKGIKLDDEKFCVSCQNVDDVVYEFGKFIETLDPMYVETGNEIRNGFLEPLMQMQAINASFLKKLKEGGDHDSQ